MDRAQAQALMAQGAAMRQELFGSVDDNRQPVHLVYDYENAPQNFTGYYTPVRSAQQLDSIGFKLVHDAVVRFLRTVPFAPQLGKKIKITEGARVLILQFAEFGSHPANPEYVIGCKALS